jgi:UDP-N-acetylglucosamine acyltransferase
MIHSTAVIHPKAQLGANIRVGANAVIDEGVTLGDDCVVGPHAYLTGQTTIGRRNQFFPGAIIGEAPQDLRYRGEPTRVCIGDDNVFREHVTVHRSNNLTEDTIIGSNNFLMANSHVGHNSPMAPCWGGMSPWPTACSSRAIVCSTSLCAWEPWP